jgi:hypothetical protein
MSKSVAQLVSPLGNFPGRSLFAGERTVEKFGDRFFLFFPCNPLKLHETAKEKLGDSKEKFGSSKRMLGKKKKKFGGAGDFKRAPPARATPRERWVTPLGRRPRLHARRRGQPG